MFGTAAALRPKLRRTDGDLLCPLHVETSQTDWGLTVALGGGDETRKASWVF